MLHPMMNEQIALEAEMREATRARYFRNHEKAEERDDFADTHAGRQTLDFMLLNFIQGIEAWVEEKKAGKAGRRPRALKLIEEFGDVDTMAFIFLRWVINTTMTTSKGGKGKNARKTRVVLSATQGIHDEFRMRYFAENRKALLKKIVKDFQRRDLPRRRRRELMVRTFHQQQLEWKAEGWGQSERLNLGLVLLQILSSTTGVIEEFVQYDGARSVDCVAFAPAMIEVLADRMDKAANLFTVYYPMVVPPKDWTNDALVGGAYYTDNVQPYRFVKDAKYRYLAELENRDMSRIIDPINKMQRTAWRVNPVMVDVLDKVFSRSLDVPGLPTADPLELPKPPVGADTNEDIEKEYKKDCYEVRDTNRRMISKRIAVLRTISMANRFSRYDAIYFPHDVDSRGRSYPKVPFLNPQGTDYVKALIEFSEGKPIDTPEHEGYLAVAVSNAWGQDKLPLADRVAWVEENEVMLQEIAMDPLNDLRWTKADEPFMALRGALEWAGLCNYGTGYVSHMPVHFDATCSGLQHFSALLRDEEGGFHVNLTGHEDRQDIYKAVATKAEASLRIAADTSDFARVALEMGITRGLCKRPVMIVPYSGTFSACMDYVFDYYKEKAEGGAEMPVEMDVIRSKISPLVAKHVWDAISSTVIAARSAMDWITATARVASKNSITPLQWTTPDGFVVQQAKYDEKTRRVETYLDGKMSKLSIVDRTNKLDARKMGQSLSPNYIHSMDACHMRMAILRADGMGMSFAMIHDSFGVHAADMPRFCEECIKPAFVDMYEDGKNLERFREELMLNVKDEDTGKIKPLPEAGNLDIYQVLDSQFFFS